MKKNLFVIITFLFMFGQNTAQNADTLIINYYENFPYAYSENGKLKGIEIDIIEEYAAWVRSKKNTQITVVYKPYKEFGAFYTSVKDGRKNIVGLGSVTANSQREQEVILSAPYLQNLAVLITAGSVPSLKTKTAADVSKIFGSLSAITVNNSSHLNYLNDLKNQFLPGLKIAFAENQNKVLETIVSDNKVFGYVDIVAYWAFLKNNQSKFLKIQKVFSEPKERFSFVMPVGSVHAASMSEFFEGGFGFTSTKVYHQILEKYLGYEIIEAVEIK